MIQRQRPGNALKSVRALDRAYFLKLERFIPAATTWSRFAQHVDERVAKLRIDHPNNTLARPRLPQDKQVRSEHGQLCGETPRGGAESIATPASPTPRSSSICTKRPPNECPINSGGSGCSRMTRP